MTQIQFQNSLTNLESKMLFFAISLTCNSDKARDLVQETYLKALMYRNKFSSGTNLMAWVYTIMKNTFINDYRKSIRLKSALEFNSKTMNELRFPVDFHPAPDSTQNENEINKKIESLEEEFKDPFQLLLSGYKYKEIAEELKLPLGTVKNRIFFTRKKLSKDLREYLN